MQEKLMAWHKASREFTMRKKRRYTETHIHTLWPVSSWLTCLCGFSKCTFQNPAVVPQNAKYYVEIFASVLMTAKLLDRVFSVQAIDIKWQFMGRFDTQLLIDLVWMSLRHASLYQELRPSCIIDSDLRVKLHPYFVTHLDQPCGSFSRVEPLPCKVQIEIFMFSKWCNDKRR